MKENMHNFILFLKVEHVREAIKGIPLKDGLYQNLINQNTGQWSSSMFIHVHVHVLEYIHICNIQKCTIYMYICISIYRIAGNRVVPYIIKFTYYHCTSIDYSVLCE